MKDYDVNFNNKTILLQGEWYNVKELGEKIKYNINKGNYKIKHLSEALEKLQEVLESAKEIKILLSGETYKNLEKLSEKYGKAIDVIVRDAIDKYMSEIDENNSEEPSIDIQIEPEIKPKTTKSKPEIKPAPKPKPQILEKPKPGIIENKTIKPDKEVKKQPSIIVEDDTDDWFKN